MSKKLLNEATVRKFMKLANLSNLSSPFLKEMNYKLEEEGEIMEGEHDPELMDPEPEGDLPMDDDALEPAGGGTAEDVILAVADAIKDVAERFDVDVDVEHEDKEGDDEVPMEEEADPMHKEGHYGMEEGSHMEEDMMAEAIMNLLDKSGIEVVDEGVMTEALVKKVAARVARRLLKESL